MAAAEPQSQSFPSSGTPLTPASASQRPVRDKTSSSKKKPGFSNGADFVTLIAATEGKEEVKFVVHQDFACHYSPVLKAAFKSNFIEGQTKTYRLEGVAKITAQVLVQWLYCQNFEVETPERFKKYDINIWTQSLLIRLWILADCLLIPRLQNEVIRELHARQNKSKYISTSQLNFMYENTTEDSPLRIFYVHRCVQDLKDEIFEEKSHHFPREMLYEMALIYRKQSDKKQLKSLINMDNKSQYEVNEGLESQEVQEQ